MQGKDQALGYKVAKTLEQYEGSDDCKDWEFAGLVTTLYALKKENTSPA